MAKSWWPDPLQTLFRRLRPVLAATIFLAPLTLIGPAAFAQAVGESQKKPATREDIFLYRTIGYLTFCNARKIKVEFPQALATPTLTYGQIMRGRHGSQVAELGNKKLTDKQLYGNAEFQILAGAMVGCPDFIPADVKEKFQVKLKKIKDGEPK